MTQQPPLKWLIQASEDGPSFNALLTLACRGNDRIATLLNELLYQGACAANRTNIKPREVEFVRMHLNLDRLVQGLGRLHKSASKQTVIQWRKKLQEWGFLEFDGHRQQYDLYFHRVEAAMKTPPPKEITPRGRHVHKKEIQASTEGDSSLDNERFKCGDGRDSSVEEGYSTLDAKGEIKVLTSEVSRLESHISKVESEMLKLESLISQERACRAALEAKYDALYNILLQSSTITLNERERRNVTATSSPPEDCSFTHSSSDDFVVSPGETQHTSVQQSSEVVAVSGLATTEPAQQSNKTVAQPLHHDAPTDDANDAPQQAGDVENTITAESHIAIPTHNMHNTTKDASSQQCSPAEQNVVNSAVPDSLEQQAEMQNRQDNTPVENSVDVGAHGYTIASEVVNEEVADTYGITGGNVTQGQVVVGTQEVSTVVGSQIDEKGQNFNATPPARVTMVNKTGTKKTAKNTTKIMVVLTPDEQRVNDFYCHLWFVKVPPKINETLKQHWSRLVPVVKTQEDMESLYKYTRKECSFLKSPVVHPGNLVNCVNNWLQTRPVQPVQQTLPVARPVGAMSEIQANALARKAVLLAQEQEREVQAMAHLKNATWFVVVDWKTHGFSKPEEFSDEEQFNTAFTEMCKLWGLTPVPQRSTMRA